MYDPTQQLESAYASYLETAERLADIAADMDKNGLDASPYDAALEIFAVRICDIREYLDGQ